MAEPFGPVPVTVLAPKVGGVVLEPERGGAAYGTVRADPSAPQQGAADRASGGPPAALTRPP